MYTTEQTAEIFQDFMSKIENGIVSSSKGDVTNRLIERSSIIDKWKSFKIKNNLQPKIGNCFPVTSVVKNVKNRSGWSVWDDKSFVFSPPVSDTVNINIEKAKIYIRIFKETDFLSGFTIDEMAKVTAVVVWYTKTKHVPFPLRIGKFTITE